MINGVRQFKLINALGAEYDMTRPDALLHAPDGLGWGTEATVNRLGMTYIGINEKEIHQSPSGEMVFRTYEEYGRFLSFCQQGGLVLCYKPLDTWYYCEALISIQKSEIQWENNHLICPVQFTLLSYWYEKVVAQTAEPVEPSYRTVTGDPAVFNARYSYPIKDLSVAIQGSQDLNGYRSPWVGGAGKNKCSGVQLQGNNNIRFYFDKSIEKTVTISFTPNVALTNNSLYLVIDGTSVGIAATITGNANEKNIKTFTLSDSNYEAIQGATECYFLLYRSGVTFTLPTDAQIENGTTATAWEPYENIAPITAYTGRTVTQQGKNLFNKDGEIIYGYWTNSWNPIATPSGVSWCGQIIPVEEGKTYTWSGNPTEGGVYNVWLSDASDITSKISNISTTGVPARTITAPTGARAAWLALKQNTQSGWSRLQFEAGDTATEYEPYQHAETAISWETEAGEVYKGTLNVNTGVLTVNWVILTADGTTTKLSAGYGGSGPNRLPVLNVATYGAGLGSAPLSNMLIYSGRIMSNKASMYWANRAHTSIAVHIGDYQGTDGTHGYNSYQEVLTAVNAYLADNNLTITYELATPLTYTLTPTQLSNLIGQNSIKADAGAVTVTYRTDARTEYKIYPYQYSYRYGDTAQNVFDITCDLPSYFKLTIFGERTNPSWRVVQNGSIVKSGKLNATIGSLQKLVINTDPKNTEIALYTLSNTRINNLYGYSDFATERIFALPQGESQLQVLTEDEQSPKVMIEVLKHV